MGTRPARPHTRLTADGRRLAEVVSYTSRDSVLSDKQAEEWAGHATRWSIPAERADDPDFELDSWFGRSAPLIVEIGSGVGEATAALAATRPEANILAFEVWQPGVASTFTRLEQAGVTNVRLMGVDAVWSFEHLLGRETVEQMWTFFPDPWPKKRHDRRRLVSPRFASLAASRLVPGGLWRLATDWPAYAGQILDVLAAAPLLQNVHDGPAPRWDERPPTRFERRGVAAGRSITDLTFRRV